MTMEFGIFLPIFLPEHAGHAVSRFAQTAEELGFDSLWTGDHVAVPRDSASSYPYGKELLATGVIPDAETASTMMPSGLPDALGDSSSQLKLGCPGDISDFGIPATVILAGYLPVLRGEFHCLSAPIPRS